MKLPNAKHVVISSAKLRNYLLSPTHPIGRYKAVFFRGLGYEQNQWKVLEKDLRRLLNQEAEEIEVTEYGTKYAVRGQIVGPNGRAADIISVWIILNGENVPRFVTAYPED
ncbi:DUF6883 domain-containing protein [Methylohalobius crimeensis]|uniref:DUF6883 domain-containing protein n=1 Tax=Methylohalobius crimeensis TaxID=244365 RepID=UPI0003B67FCC|nr:DUF6883 domain-containing protein [Methylohalobius crimeensis]